MTLGILVNTDKNKEAIIGTTKASIKRGHRVILFFMDEGCNLLKDGEITALRNIEGVSISICDFNRKKIGIKDIPKGILCGSQYDNAVMNRESDKVIIL